MPAINIKNGKEERLPVLITYGKNEQLIAVPQLQNSSGKEQAQAVWSSIVNWNLEDSVQILCCDTTASNTGRFKGACVQLEQKFDRELLFFACRHHVYELVLKSAFECKLSENKVGPEVNLFKKFKENWSNINSRNIQYFQNDINKQISPEKLKIF